MAKREQTIEDLPDNVLRSIIALCPRKAGETMKISVSGMKSVTLTYESRQRGEAELKRRKAAKKEVR